MKTIQKLTLTTDEQAQTLSFKEGYRIVRIEYLVTEKRICMWVEVPLRADIGDVRKTYVVKKTHEPVPAEFQHVYTAIDLLKPEAFHIFELPAGLETTKPSWGAWRASEQEREVAA